DAAVAARDAAALSTLIADAAEFVEHQAGAVRDREGVLQSLHSLLDARDPPIRHEPLATLGDALALCRVSWSGSGLAAGKFDVGAHETQAFVVVEVDAHGRRRWHEHFALDRLGDAIVRLQERYAELLPEGPTRTRAAARARAMAARVAPIDIDRYAQSYAPGIEAVGRQHL